jgi:hypothetical protein
MREVELVEVRHALEIQVEERIWQVQCDSLAKICNNVIIREGICSRAGVKEAVFQVTPFHEATLASVVKKVEPIIQTLLE